MAAYIPPHKRHSTGVSGSGGSGSAVKPTPTPESFSPHFKRGLNFKSSFSDKKNNKDRGKGGGGQKIIYAQYPVYKWFPVGFASSSDDDSDYNDAQFMSLTRLEPISEESFDLKSECSEERRVFMDNPWLFVAENVKHDLLSAFQRVQNEMEDKDFVQVKPNLTARFGRILFHGCMKERKNRRKYFKLLADRL